MSAARVSASSDINASKKAKQSTAKLLELEEEIFRAKFNRKPFIIAHDLVNHPLFTLAQLIELSKRLPAENVKYNAGDIPPATTLYEGPQTGLSVEETIRRIEECSSWMV